jgi:transposase
MHASSTMFREQRRDEAVRLLRQGDSKAGVARRFGVSKEAVRKWWKSYETGGMKALKARPRRGARPKLSREKLLRRLPELLLEGAEQHGFRTDLWTLDRVGKVIAREMGVKYSSAQTWRLLDELLGWSWQKPEMRARERDEDAVRKWKKRRWPRVKKTRSRAARR